MEAKYLSDGRKVAVIGKLNNVESIVQEIFVTKQGDEVPGGERFVTKSLHDEPVISYKEKEKVKLAEAIVVYERNRDIAKDKAKKAEGELKALQGLLTRVKKLSDLIPESELEVFTMFMTGTVEYLVVGGYSITAPVKMLDKIIQWSDNWGDREYDGIKLLTVLGKSEGNLEYRINQYSDGSGSSNECYPFKNYDDALSYIRSTAIRRIEKDRLSVEEFNLCKDLGITLPKETLHLYRANRKKSIEKSLVAVNKNQAELDERLEKHNAELNELQDNQS